jgi:hypothetical protein
MTDEGVQSAGYFLGTSELTFGTLILLGYWSRKLGILGALGSIVTFVGTVGIIFFLPDAWAKEAGGFPIMTLPLGFLMKDFLFLAQAAPSPPRRRLKTPARTGSPARCGLRSRRLLPAEFRGAPCGRFESWCVRS